jgi:hypothetical protein
LLLYHFSDWKAVKIEQALADFDIQQALVKKYGISSEQIFARINQRISADHFQQKPVCLLVSEIL